MKKWLLILAASAGLCSAQIDLNSALDHINNSTQQMREDVNRAAENGNNKNTNTNEGNGNNGNTSADNTGDSNNSQQTTANTSKPTLKTYQNFDFVAGEKILFEDNFETDMDGEFPAHWELKNGQAILNKLEGELAFFITDGNYGTVNPRMKTDNYLGPEFTIEFDYYNYKPQDGSAAYGLVVMLTSWIEDGGYEHDNSLQISPTSVSMSGNEVSLSKSLPSEMYGDDKFSNKFHHISIAVKNRQMKVYVDQTRILVVPDTKADFRRVSFGGIASDDYPLIFKNVKIAEGGKMNMLDKITSDGKIVTHGILFDINKATIKPESMGVINQIFQLMKDSPDLKFEIGGYTDSDGDDNSNLKLSEQRANAVRDQLVSMGIGADRFTTKGYGETKPIDSNTTPEGKANNRRVEFTKF